ncbi:hypothetical protein AX16_006771 [Volvariella volvacea WC 439]|nr:hypothetical protein AX16_006771 [Volvariella volvacea WC 439]
MASYLSSLPIGAYALIVVLCMMRRTVHVAFAVGTLAIQYFYAAAIIAIKYYAPRFGTNPECFRELYLPFEGLQNLDTYRTRSLVFSYVGLGVIVVESFVIGFLCWWWARKPATEPPSALDMNLAKSGKGAGSDIEEGSGVNGVWSSGPQEGAVKPTPQKHDEVPSTEESRPPTGHQCTCACGHKWVPGDVEPLDSKKGEGLLLGFDFIFVLICTTVVYVVLVVRIEIFRMQNRDLLGQPAEEWTLGQILAVALAIPPVFETLRIMWSYFRRVRDPNVKFFNRKSIILSSLKDAFKFIVGRVRAAI